MKTLEAFDRTQTRNKFSTLYPTTGLLRRELYAKHLEFFKLGKEYSERALFGGNRSGKTLAGGYECTAHLTGLYPDWWEGYRFDHPIAMWAAGDTAKTTRNILQRMFIGPPGDVSQWGSGMIPADLIVRTTPKHGIADAIESAYVKYKGGGRSELQFLSYDQGRESFQGTEQHVVLLDEDCSEEIFVECLLRTMTSRGLILWTATLVEGISPLMLSFMPHLRPTPE